MLVLIFALVFYFVSERTMIFAPEAPPDQVTVTFWAFSTPAKTMAQLKGRFEQKYQAENITVEVQTVAWESLQSKTLWAIAANSNVPDVVVCSSEWMGGLVSNGALSPLDGADEGQFAPEFFDRYFPATLGIYQFPEIDRERPEWRGRMRQYGVPLDLDLMMIFYRSDILDPILRTLGMTEFPKTWSDFERLARAVRDLALDSRQPVHLLFLDPDDVVPISMAFLPASGGSFLDASLTRATFDTPEAIAAFEFFHRLLHQDLALPWTRKTMENPVVLFKTGRALANISGPWYAKLLQTTAPELTGKWRVALFPRRSEELPSCGLGGACLAMPYNARHKREARMLIDFMASDDFGMEYFNRVGSPPPQRTVWGNKVFSEGVAYFGGQNVYAVGRAAIESARPLQLMPNPEIVKGPIRQALHDIIVREADATGTLRRAVREANRLLGQD